MITKNKTQSLSTDLIVVVVIILFGALFLVIYQIGNVEEGPSLDDKYEEASLQSQLIVDSLKEDQILDAENQINVDRLLQLNDEEIKEKLNIDNDFAIVFEKDGKLVKIDPENDINCIGSDKIVINGVSCR